MIRRWILAVLVLLLALLVIGSIFYIPPSAMEILKPVPAHAQIVYLNSTPDLSVLEKFHFPSGWKEDRLFLNTLEGHPLTLAAVSLGGRNRRDTWVVASAVGPQSVFLRWRLTFFPPEGVKLSRPYGGWPVWQYSNPDLPVWTRIRFSIAEGLLICSISDDSHDICYLLDTLDGRRPSAARRGKL